MIFVFILAIGIFIFLISYHYWIELKKKKEINILIYADVVELGSDGSAAGGGRSDLSEWPRSVCNAAARRQGAHRAPQQGERLLSRRLI